MFDYNKDGPCYYVRLEKRSDYLNLLYIPKQGIATPEANQALLHLFREYSNEGGTIVYFDPDEYCLIAEKAKEFKGLRVYLYDDNAPYDGFYMDGRYIETLENVS